MCVYVFLCVFVCVCVEEATVGESSEGRHFERDLCRPTASTTIMVQL